MTELACCRIDYCIENMMTCVKSEKRLNTKKRWGEKNDVEVWGCCGLCGELMLQDYGPVVLGASKCTSLQIIVAADRKKRTHGHKHKDIYYLCNKKCRRRLTPVLFSPVAH